MNFFTFFRSLRALSLLGLLITQVAQSKVSGVSNGDLETQFQRAFGTFVTDKKLEKSQELTNKISTALAKALKEHLRENYQATPDLEFDTKIYESKDINAMIAPEIASDRKKISAKIFVSSAVYDMIAKKVVALPEPEATHETIRQLSGVLAHEFAHVIDKFDPKGIDNFWGNGRSKQGVEVRTDFEATELLERAGLPRDGTYSFLSHLAKVDMPAALRFMPVGESYLQTHPEMNLRQTLNRAFLTLRRYAKGLATPLNKENFQRQLPQTLQDFGQIPMKKTLGEEIKAFTQTRRAVVTATDLSQKLDAYEARLPMSKESVFRKETHSALTSVLLAARSRTDQLSSSEKTRIFDAVKSYYEVYPYVTSDEMYQSEHEIFQQNRSGWGSNDTKQNLTFSTESPAEILKALNFGKDPAYVQKVKEFAKTAVAKERGFVNPLARVLGCFLPRETVYSSAPEMFIERIKLTDRYPDISSMAQEIGIFTGNLSREDKTLDCGHFTGVEQPRA